jgi:hypothetical protein
MGIFNVLNKEALKRNDGKPVPLYTKAVLGLTAGGIGAFVGTPADLTLIRMQAGVLLASPPVFLLKVAQYPYMLVPRCNHVLLENSSKIYCLQLF